MIIAGLADAAFALAGSADVVVCNGRSQYGDEQAFKAFEEQTGLDVELRGGTAPELYERLRRRATRRTPTCSSPPTSPTCGAPRRAGLLEAHADDIESQVAPAARPRHLVWA